MYLQLQQTHVEPRNKKKRSKINQVPKVIIFWSIPPLTSTTIIIIPTSATHLTNWTLKVNSYAPIKRADLVQCDKENKRAD